MRLRQILILLIAIVAVTDAVAQRESSSPKIGMIYGVSGGIMVPLMDFKGEDIDVSSNIGFKGGLMWGVDMGFMEIVPEIWYSTFKMEFSEGGSGLKGAELKNSSLDLPVMVGIKVSKKIKVKVGPSFSLMCNNTLTDSDGEAYEFGRLKGSIGYVAGASYNITKKFFVEARYTGRMTSYENEFSSEDDPYKIDMYTIDITAGFRF